MKDKQENDNHDVPPQPAPGIHIQYSRDFMLALQNSPLSKQIVNFELDQVDTPTHKKRRKTT